MLFPDASPSREDCNAAIDAALQHSGSFIYLDTSVLVHCYEMSPAASEELIRTLEIYGDRVCVPVWAARETWDKVTKQTTKRPLRSIADKLSKELKRFRVETTRYLDDGNLNDMTRDEYQYALGNAVDTVIRLAQRVANLEPKADQTTARLLPFIEGRRLSSNLEPILKEVAATATSRMSHRIPPGFGDVSPPRSDDNEDETASAQIKGKGKSLNPHGDLIIWLEILADCHQRNADHLVIITRDTQKDDWVYVPKKIRDAKGRPQDNDGQVMLPQPLLVHEAKMRCPNLKSVHIVTVEMLARIWSLARFDVAKLAAALQAEEEWASKDNPQIEIQRDPLPASDENYQFEFGSNDMAYDPNPQNELDQLILDLEADGWKTQNLAVRRLEPNLLAFDRAQRIQIGRGLVLAANEGALEPTEFLERLLSNDSFANPLRGDILIGVLAEVYLAETGEPKKPVAKPSIIRSLYRYQNSIPLAKAYDSVLSRLRPIRRKYLSFPTDIAENVALEIATQKGTLLNVSLPDVALLEQDAPASRLLQRGGRDANMTIGELVELIAEEFVVPSDHFVIDVSRTSSIKIPELIGFVSWGPKAGIMLR